MDSLHEVLLALAVTFGGIACYLFGRVFIKLIEWLDKWLDG